LTHRRVIAVVVGQYPFKVEHDWRKLLISTRCGASRAPVSWISAFTLRGCPALLLVAALLIKLQAFGESAEADLRRAFRTQVLRADFLWLGVQQPRQLRTEIAERLDS
jgi:hypothetical protein